MKVISSLHSIAIARCACPSWARDGSSSVLPCSHVDIHAHGLDAWAADAYRYDTSAAYQGGESSDFVSRVDEGLLETFVLTRE